MAILLARERTLVDRFRKIAACQAGKPFVILHDRAVPPLTFGDAFARAERFAAAYAARGVRPRDVVALMLPTHRDAASAFFGAMMIGAVPAFFPPLSPKQDASIFWASHGALFIRIEVELIVSDQFNLGLIETHLPAFADRCLDIDADHEGIAGVTTIATRADIALLQHSSGTTGLKKGVALTHGMVLDHVDRFATCLAIAREDTIVSWLPLYHDMGLIACFIAPALLGLTVVMLDPFEWVRRPTSLFDAVAAHQATLCWLPNFAFHHLIRMADPAAHHDLSSLRAVIDCSEPCKPETLEMFRVRFAGDGLAATAPQVCYAMAETVFLVTQTPLDAVPRHMVVDAELLGREGVALPVAPGETQGERALLSCGVPGPGVRIRILDADGSPCPDRQIGEIVVSSDTLFDGYYRLEMPPGRLDAGWYRTGDRGFLDGGELFVTGRNDDLLIVNGKNIYAHDVEFCVNTNCAAKAGRVVAIAPYNPQSGSQSLVVIAEADATDAASRTALSRAIKAAVNAEFAATVFEAMIVAPGWLIKTTSGKISRADNLKRYVAERPLFGKHAS